MEKIVIATKRKSEDVKELQETIRVLENTVNTLMAGKEFIKLERLKHANNEDLAIFSIFKALVKAKLGNDEYLSLIQKAEKLSK